MGLFCETDKFALLSITCLQVSEADTQVSGCVWLVHLGRILFPGFCQGHHRRLAQPEGRRRLSQASCH